MTRLGFLRAAWANAPIRVLPPTPATSVAWLPRSFSLSSLGTQQLLDKSPSRQTMCDEDVCAFMAERAMVESTLSDDDQFDVEYLSSFVCRRMRHPCETIQPARV
jgi:hypothetical protein